MIFPIVEMAVSAALGAADGWLASTDTAAGRTSIASERSTWLKGAAFLLGAGLDFAGWNEAVTESLMGVSLALFARQLTYKAAQSGAATPVMAQGFDAYIGQGGDAYSIAPGTGRTVQYTQPVSVLG